MKYCALINVINKHFINLKKLAMELVGESNV